MKTRVKNHTDLGNKGKDLREFAANYLSEAFPNPGRDGCPPDSALRSLAFNPKEAEPIVTEHLAACSPCFRRYSELLAELMAQQRVEKASSWKRISAWTKAHPVLVAAALACALFIAIGVDLLLRGIRQPNAPPMDTHRKPNPTEPLTPTAAYAAFSLDLSALSPVRGGEGPHSGHRRLSVPASTLRAFTATYRRKRAQVEAKCCISRSGSERLCWIWLSVGIHWRGIRLSNSAEQQI